MADRLSDAAQTAILIIVLMSAVFLAYDSEQPEIVFSLATLAFGYYFGSAKQRPKQ